MGVQWDTTVADGRPITVTKCSENADTQAEETRTAYTLEFADTPFGLADIQVVRPETARWQTTSRTANPDQLTVTTPHETSYERVIITANDRRIVLVVPGGRLLELCTDAIQGDETAANQLVRIFETPVQIPVICGAFLSVEDTIKLLKTVAASNSYAASLLHSYRYEIVRSGLVGHSGLSIETKAELEAFVQGLNEIDAIGRVRVVDAVVDVMATVHETVSETEELLAALGYDRQAFERRHDGLFFACRLAKQSVADGVRAAEGDAMRRRWNIDGNYKRRKAAAESAAYENRDTAWRTLICAAGRESLDEFCYVLANALHWSGEVTRSDSRVAELLYTGAVSVASANELSQVEGRARFKRHIAAGHRLRSRHCFAPAVGRFTTAEQIAGRYSALPDWKPVYNKGVVRAHLLSEQGDHDAAIESLDQTIDEIVEYDLSPDQSNHCVHHLEGQKCEIKALQAESEQPRNAIEALEEAQTHYETIGFDRSSNRVERKLDKIERTIQTETSTDESETTVTGETDAGRSQNTSSRKPASGNQSTAADRSSTQEYKEWLEGDTGHRDETPDPTNEVQESTIMDGPDQQRDQHDDVDDPYMF